MNSHEHPNLKGCPAAVVRSGTAHKNYCDGKSYKGDYEKYPWWKECCEWKDSKCVAKSNTQIYYILELCFNWPGILDITYHT